MESLRLAAIDGGYQAAVNGIAQAIWDRAAVPGRRLMRLAIVGSRDYPYLEQVRGYVRALSEDTVVVTGGARGVDRVAEAEARQRGLVVDVRRAKWDEYGRGAGARRNRLLLDASDKVVAFWDGKSPGTIDTIKEALHRYLEVEAFTTAGCPRCGGYLVWLTDGWSCPAGLDTFAPAEIRGR
jgi:predicted Rossmann fold nucleotide-binding protein DprA/Smf involved in DNA uptake